MEEEIQKLTAGQGDTLGRDSDKGLRDLLVVQAERWREGEEVKTHLLFGIHCAHNFRSCM